jgi:hypothetical protein
VSHELLAHIGSYLRLNMQNGKTWTSQTHKLEDVII